MSQSPKSETSIALYLHPAPFKELTDEELGNVLFRVRLNDTMTAGEAHLRIAKTIQEAVMEKNQ